MDLCKQIRTFWTAADRNPQRYGSEVCAHLRLAVWSRRGSQQDAGTLTAMMGSVIGDRPLTGCWRLSSAGSLYSIAATRRFARQKLATGPGERTVAALHQGAPLAGRSTALAPAPPIAVLCFYHIWPLTALFVLFWQWNNLSGVGGLCVLIATTKMAGGCCDLEVTWLLCCAGAATEREIPSERR